MVVMIIVELGLYGVYYVSKFAVKTAYWGVKRMMYGKQPTQYELIEDRLSKLEKFCDEHTYIT